MVELSSTEAEYMALSQAAQESVWLKTFLCELGEMSKGDAVKIYEDNQGSIGRAVQESYVPQMRKAHLNEVMSAMESSDAAKWQEACSLEMESLRKNKTWKLVSLPKARKSIGNRWVFRVMENQSGEVER